MLEIQNVSKTFNAGTVNEKTALNGLNLKLNEGDFVTVIGGNGAGREVHLTQCLTVHLRTGNDDSSGYEVLNLILLAVPLSIDLRTDESLDSLGISLCTNHEQLVAYLEGCLAVRDAHLSVVEES